MWEIARHTAGSTIRFSKKPGLATIIRASVAVAIVCVAEGNLAFSRNAVARGVHWRAQIIAGATMFQARQIFFTARRILSIAVMKPKITIEPAHTADTGRRGMRPRLTLVIALSAMNGACIRIDAACPA
jgi:hypothetical protein